MRLIFALLTLLFSAQSALAQGEARIISVSGTGAVLITPDIARVSLGVRTQARTANDALSSNSKIMAQVIDTLASNNVEKSDIQTNQLSLFPQWDRRNTNDQIIGYQAQNQVSITLRDLETLGFLLDQLARVGANNIQSISFDISDATTAKNQARELAISDARARAKLYANAADVVLGEVLSISEPSARLAPQMAMGRAQMEMAASVPIEQGSMSINAQINMVFEIAK